MQCGSCTYLQPGSPHAGCLEQTADGILGYPRSLWLNREVTAVQKGERWEVSYDVPEFGGCQFQDCLFSRYSEDELTKEKTDCFPCCILMPIFCIVAPFNFALVQLPGLVFSAIGMPIKAVVLGTSDKAASYSKLCQSCLNHEKLLAEKANIEKKLLQNEEAMRFEKDTLSQLSRSKNNLIQLQKDLKTVKEANVLTPLIKSIDKKDRVFYGLLNNVFPLQEELRAINIKIEACENLTKQIANEYQNANQ